MHILKTALSGLIRHYLLLYPSHVHFPLVRDDPFFSFLKEKLLPSLEEMFPSSYQVDIFCGENSYNEYPLVMARDKNVFPSFSEGIFLSLLLDTKKGHLYFGLQQSEANIVNQYGKEDGALLLLILKETMKRLLEEENVFMPPLDVSLETKYKTLENSFLFALRYDYFSLQNDLLLKGSKILLTAYRALMNAIGNDYKELLDSVLSEILLSSEECISSLKGQILGARRDSISVLNEKQSL